MRQVWYKEQHLLLTLVEEIQWCSMAETESWNGTSWTEVGDLNTARFGVMAFGTILLL
jgi:hypothetical protein